MAHLRYKAKWLGYLDAITHSLTVRRAACELDIHRNTAFRWRHRFLTWIKQDRPTTLHGITEADETYILESHKGSRKLERKSRKRGGSARKRGISNEQVWILMARDRSKQTVDFVTGHGATTKAILTAYLKPILDSDSLLVSDSNPTYDAFCSAENITHEAVNLSQGQRVIKGIPCAKC